MTRNLTSQLAQLAHLAHWLMLVLLRAAAVSACPPLVTTTASFLMCSLAPIRTAVGLSS